MSAYTMQQLAAMPVSAARITADTLQKLHSSMIEGWYGIKLSKSGDSILTTSSTRFHRFEDCVESCDKYNSFIGMSHKDVAAFECYAKSDVILINTDNIW